MGNRRRRDQLRPGGIDVQHPDENIGIEFPEFRRCAEGVVPNRLGAECGIVEDDIEAAEIFGSVMDGGRRTVRIADICAQRQDGVFAADFLNLERDFLQFLAVEIDKGELCTLFRRASAMARPSPRPAPVSMTTFPVSFPSVIFIACISVATRVVFRTDCLSAELGPGDRIAAGPQVFFSAL